MFSKSEHYKDTLRAVLALALCALVLGVFVVLLGGYRFWEKLDVYYLHFLSVKDLADGRPVKYGGLDVGRILSINVDPDNPRLILVTIGLRERIALHQGLVARIAQKGLVGDYYVFLDPQREPGPVIPPGSFLPTVESVDMSQLAAMVGDVVRDLKPRLEQIATSLEQVLSKENAQHVSELLAKAPVLVDQITQTARQVQSDFSKFAGSGNEAAISARQALNTLNASTEKLTGDLQRAIGDIRSELRQVNTLTEGMNKAVRYDQARLEDILDNVDRISDDLKHLVEKLREHPWELLGPALERAPKSGRAGKP